MNIDQVETLLHFMEGKLENILNTVQGMFADQFISHYNRGMLDRMIVETSYYLDALASCSLRNTMANKTINARINSEIGKVFATQVMLKEVSAGRSSQQAITDLLASWA